MEVKQCLATQQCQEPKLHSAVYARGDINMLLCRLVNVDIYTFDFKLNHIAKHLQLPATPKLGPAALDMPPGERLPPVLVVNVQLPAYPVSMAAGLPACTCMPCSNNNIFRFTLQLFFITSWCKTTICVLLSSTGIVVCIVSHGLDYVKAMSHSQPWPFMWH